MGVDSSGANVNKVIVIPPDAFVGTSYEVYNDASDVVSANITFGDPYNDGNISSLSILRQSGDYYWVGTLTSTEVQ